MGNWTTDKTTTYKNVRLVSDAKHFPARGEGDTYQAAATFLTIVDGTKDGQDIFVDAKVTRGAAKLAGLKKGHEATVEGTVEFKVDEKTGRLKGKIWDARVSLGYAVRQELGAAAADAAAAPTDAPAADDSAAPAFE